MFSLMRVFGLLLIYFYSQVGAVTFKEFPPQIVKESIEVQIPCSHDDNAKLQMLWYQQKKDSQSMTLIGFVYGQGSPTYEGQFEQQFKLTKEETTKGKLIIRSANPSDSAVYFCAATDNNAQPAYFGQGTKLTVLEKDHATKKPTVKVLPPSTKECRNKINPDKRKKTLLCVASEFYPDHVKVSWEVNGAKRVVGVATDNQASRPGSGANYKITSRLRVPAEEWFNPNNKFECIVNFYDGTATEDIKKIKYGVEAPDTGNTMNKETYLRKSQIGKLAYGVLITKSFVYGAFVMLVVWKLQGSSGKRNN
ncbi:T cell receptor beta chain MC.7.G5-like [Pagrus major]|uniref:T cell receptor beta chain MC.7.G5-like n=1 Tax=Pagrus major TaxID=143350 RepID=UPI003CC8BDC1